MADTNAVLERALVELTNEVRALRAELAANRNPTPTTSTAPLTAWSTIAEALGVSVDTLRRRRADAGDKKERRPYFEDLAAARTWWAEILARGGHAAPPAPAPRRARPARARKVSDERPVDWDEVARGG